MSSEVLQGILIPFLGTTLGSACVFFMKKSLDPMLRRALTGFAAGVMTAAAVWSLLIPSMEQSEDMGKWAFVPAAVGFWLGILFLLILDKIIPHLHQGSSEPEGIKSQLQKTTMLVLAVANLIKRSLNRNMYVLELACGTGILSVQANVKGELGL